MLQDHIPNQGRSYTLVSAEYSKVKEADIHFILHGIRAQGFPLKISLLFSAAGGLLQCTYSSSDHV
ncbi:hypothetical protein KY284_017090 [Solanum tuberosum]|nr:hypothetical protein KY284_017090 [Solanum tuberosum]